MASPEIPDDEALESQVQAFVDQVRASERCAEAAEDESTAIHDLMNSEIRRGWAERNEGCRRIAPKINR